MSEVRAGRRSRRGGESGRGRLAALAGYFVLTVLYAPIVWLAVMSVSAEPLSGIPGPFTGEWYRSLFRSTRWVDPLWTSLGVSTAVGAACMVIATLVGRSLPQVRGRGTVLVCAVVPLFVPGVVMGTALFMYFRSLMGFKLGLWSLVAGHFVWAFPFSLLAVVVMASRFDTRLVDAAADLGATPWQRFWHIEFPALMPGIAAAGLFGFLLSFNELSRSIFLHGRVTTLSLYAWAETSSHTSKVPLIYSLNTLVLLVSLVLVCSAFWLLFARKGR